MLLAMLLATLILACWFLVPFAWRKIEERRLARLCRDNRTIVLTYDDGPGPRLTPQLLELLKGHDVPASFFPLGRNATKNEEGRHPGQRDSLCSSSLCPFAPLNTKENSPWRPRRPDRSVRS